MRETLFKVSAFMTVIALMFTLTAYSQPPAQAASKKEGIINANDVNLRKKPSLDAEILAKIKEDEIVTVVSEKSGWYKLKYEKLTGYVKTQFVTVHETGLNIHATVIKDNVNMRKEPNTNSKSVQKIKRYTDVTIIGTFGDWYEVKSGSKKGYIRNDLINKVEEISVSAEGTITAGDVNMRKLPIPTGKIITQLKKGASVTVIKLRDDWVYLSYGKKKGYVFKNYVKFESATGSPYSTLKTGMKGKSVVELQEKLQQKGYFKGKVTGNYGALTKSAIIKFQEVMGADTDGVAGPLTLVLLYGNKPAPAKSNDKDFIPPAQPPQINGKVELRDWFNDMESVIKKYVPFEVIDVRTGISFTMRRFGGRWHADVEPLTMEDTEKMTEAWGGQLNWTRRPVWVHFEDKYYAASLMGYVHGSDIILDNGMNGQVCLHFRGSKIHASGHVDPRHQACIMEAFDAAQKLEQYQGESVTE